MPHKLKKKKKALEHIGQCTWTGMPQILIAGAWIQQPWDKITGVHRLNGLEQNHQCTWTELNRQRTSTGNPAMWQNHQFSWTETPRTESPVYMDQKPSSRITSVHGVKGLEPNHACTWTGNLSSWENHKCTWTGNLSSRQNHKCTCTNKKRV